MTLKITNFLVQFTFLGLADLVLARVFAHTRFLNAWSDFVSRVLPCRVTRHTRQIVLMSASLSLESRLCDFLELFLLRSPTSATAKLTFPRQNLLFHGKTYFLTANLLFMRDKVSDRPAQTPSKVLVVVSHDSLSVRFLIQQAYLDKK